MDKTDMQLLASAAKAAGIDVWFPRMNGGKSDNGTRVILTPCHTRNAVGDVVEWNPLTDDGDALRLLETLDRAVWSRGFSGGLRRVKA